MLDGRSVEPADTLPADAEDLGDNSLRVWLGEANRGELETIERLGERLKDLIHGLIASPARRPASVAAATKSARRKRSSFPFNFRAMWPYSRRVKLVVVSTRQRTVADAERGKASTGIAVCAARLWALDLLDRTADVAAPHSDPHARTLARPRG